MFRTVLAVTALALFAATGPSHAYRLADDAPLPAPSPRMEDPVAVVATAVDALNAFVSEHADAPPAAWHAAVDGIAGNLFDFDGLGRFAAGRLAGRLDTPARTAVARGIRTLLVGALVRHLGGLDGVMPPVRLQSVPTTHEGQARVRARVGDRNAGALVLDFRLYLRDDGWRVFDVSANGHSAATYYRALVQREWHRDRLAWLGSL